jgi:hypothetical protein
MALLLSLHCLLLRAVSSMLPAGALSISSRFTVHCLMLLLPVPDGAAAVFSMLPAGALSITPDMDEDTRGRTRREKNRVAARKCRAKKMAFMVELQKTLRELMRKNEEYRLQVRGAGVTYGVWGVGVHVCVRCCAVPCAWCADFT